jgi:hypothetical protein
MYYQSQEAHIWNTYTSTFKVIVLFQAKSTQILKTTCECKYICLDIWAHRILMWYLDSYTKEYASIMLILLCKSS